MDSPSLNAKIKPSWIARKLRGIAATFYPELHEQEQGGPAMTRWGVVKTVKTKSGRSQFGEFEGGANQFVIERPSGSNPIDVARALENNKGLVYAAVNARAREVMAIDWRLFKVDGDDHEEQKSHDMLDLLSITTRSELRHVCRGQRATAPGTAYHDARCRGLDSDLLVPAIDKREADP